MGSPKGRESYGDRVPVVVAGVTPCQGGREGRPQGEGAQVIGYHDRKVCVIAERRNGTGCPPRTWQERPAVQRTVPTDVQPQPVPAGLREDLRQPGRHDPRGRRRDRGRHVRGQDRPDHRGDAARTVSLQSGPADLHPEEERETAPAGTAVLVGQTRRRGGPPAAGGVLRADVLRPFARVPARQGMPHRSAGSGANLDRDHVVHRG